LNSLGGPNKASTYWERVFNIKWRNPGNTRWWSRFEIILFLHCNWNEFIRFITTAETIGEVTGNKIGRLKAVIDDPGLCAFLKLEVAVVSIVCKKLIQMTYVLEGDGPCSLIAYDCLFTGYNHLNDNVDDPGSFSETFDDGNIQRLREHMESCRDALVAIEYGDGLAADIIDGNIKTFVHLMVQSMLNYYKSVIFNADSNGESDATLQADIQLYDLCKSANPLAMRGAGRNFDNIRPAILALGRFSENEIDGMEREWKQYIRMCNALEVEANDSKWTHIMNRASMFWKYNWPQLPNLKLLALYCFTIITSSAAAERVFSLLKHTLSLSQMQAMLEDLSEVEVMAQYNKKQIGTPNELDD
jgi:hypothetical protein